VLTPRLRLTPIGLINVDDLVVLYSDPLVAFWTGPWNPETVEAWTADMATRWKIDGVGKWLARSRSDASLVGRGGFTRFDLVSCARNSLKICVESFEDLVGGLGPGEGAWVLVPDGDPGADVFLEGLQVLVHAAA